MLEEKREIDKKIRDKSNFKFFLKRPISTIQGLQNLKKL